MGSRRKYFELEIFMYKIMIIFRFRFIPPYVKIVHRRFNKTVYMTNPYLILFKGLCNSTGFEIDYTERSRKNHLELSL